MVYSLVITWFVVKSSIGWLSNHIHGWLFNHTMVGSLIIPTLCAHSSLGQSSQAWLSKRLLVNCTTIPWLSSQSSLGWLSKHPLVGCPVIFWLDVQASLGWLPYHPLVGCPSIPRLAVQSSFGSVVQFQPSLVLITTSTGVITGRR